MYYHNVMFVCSNVILIYRTGSMQTPATWFVFTSGEFKYKIVQYDIEIICHTNDIERLLMYLFFTASTKDRLMYALWTPFC